MSKHEGYRWGFTFLVADARLTEDERVGLVYEATTMYLQGERKKRVRGETYEGLLYTAGNVETLGTFSGQQFDAVIETDGGKAKLRFLVTEAMDGIAADYLDRY